MRHLMLTIRHLLLLAALSYSASAQMLLLGAGSGAGTSTVATPGLSPSSGAVPQTVTITDSTGSAVIWYNTSGTFTGCTYASCSGATQYTSSLSVTSAETLYALGTKSGMTNSSVASATYSAGSGTWTLVNHTITSAGAECGSGTFTCTVTIPATTAGNLVVLSAAAYSSAGSTQITAGAATGMTMTHCPSAFVVGGASGTYLYPDCAYSLSATGGVTSLTWTWAGSGTPNGMQLWVDEYNWSGGGGITYDTGGTLAYASGCGSTCTGVALTLGGSTDVVLQLGFVDNGITAISGSYSNPLDIDSGNTGWAVAGWINTSSGAAPTWNNTGGSMAGLAAVAFRGN